MWINKAVAPLSNKAEWSEPFPVSGVVRVMGMSKCRFFLGRSVLRKNFSGRSLKFSDNSVDWGVSTTAADSSSVDSTSSIGRTENLLLWASRRERLTSAARRQNPSS